jgi:hypothetical protein
VVCTEVLCFSASGRHIMRIVIQIPLPLETFARFDLHCNLCRRIEYDLKRSCVCVLGRDVVCANLSATFYIELGRHSTHLAIHIRLETFGRFDLQCISCRRFKYKSRCSRVCEFPNVMWFVQTYQAADVKCVVTQILCVCPWLFQTFCG